MGIKCGAIVVIAVLVAVILAGPITGGYLLTRNSRKSSPTMIWYTKTMAAGLHMRAKQRWTFRKIM